MLKLPSLFGGRNERSRRRFYIFLTLLLIFCFVQYVFQVNIPQVIFLAAAFLIAVTGDEDEIVAMCICCIPLHTFFEYAFAVLGGIIFYVLKYGKRMRLNYGILPVGIMVLWELLHCFGQRVNVTQFGGHCVAWILLAVLMCSSKHRFDYGFIVRSFVFATIAMCSCLLGKLLQAADFHLVAVFLNLQRLGVEAEEAAIKINPNTLGILCVLGVTGLTQLRLAGRGQKRDLIYSAAMLLFGMMTASRTFLVCLLFSVIMLFFSVKSRGYMKLRYLIGTLAGGVCVLFLGYLFMPDMLNYYVSRFFESDVTTGRASAMGIYHKFIVSNLNVLLYGIGLQGFSSRVLKLCPEAVHVPHNGIQELVIAWGIPGLFIIAWLWGAMIVRARKSCRKQSLIHYVPLLVILLKIQAGQMLNSSYTMLTLSLAYLSMSTDLSGRNDAETANLTAFADCDGIGFGRFIGMMFRKWRIVAVSSVICGILACGIMSCVTKPMYESGTMFYVNNRVSLGDSVEHTSKDDIWVSRNLVDSYAVILKSRSFLSKVMESTGLEIPYDNLCEMISVQSENETEIFRVTVTAADSTAAEKIANGIAVLLPEHIENIILGASAKVVDYAVVSSEPSSPGKAANAVLGAMFGVMLSAMLIFSDAMSNKTIRSLEGIEELQEYALLAAIPDLSKRYGDK